jgi:hypothetical protein
METFKIALLVDMVQIKDCHQVLVMAHVQLAFSARQEVDGLRKGNVVPKGVAITIAPQGVEHQR